jgi:hypothetical protein
MRGLWAYPSPLPFQGRGRKKGVVVRAAWRTTTRCSEKTYPCKVPNRGTAYAIRSDDANDNALPGFEVIIEKIQLHRVVLLPVCEQTGIIARDTAI